MGEELRGGMEAAEAEFVPLNAEFVIAEAKARKLAQGASPE